MIEFIDGYATESGEILVYLFDPGSGELLGKTLAHVSEGCGLSPGQTIDTPPRAKQAGIMVWENGAWVEREDHRGTVYRTEDGEAVEHVLIGPLPKTLTKQQRPSINHLWKGTAWVFDQVAADKHKREQDLKRARAYLASTDWYIVRQQETGQAIPVDVVAARAAARTAASKGEGSDV